jgi:primosomal protein N' (replication factor Y) (superfamily II helicase)
VTSQNSFSPSSEILWDIAIAAPFHHLLTYSAPKEFPIQRGSVVKVPLRNSYRYGVCLQKTPHPELLTKPSEDSPEPSSSKVQIKAILDLAFNGLIVSEEYLKWAFWMSEYYVYPLGLVLESLFPPLNRVQSRPRKKIGSKENPSYQKWPLNPEQDEIFNQIRAHHYFGVHLIDGVTGSGKTEIYLELFEFFLREGGQGLFMLPEISLTPQMLNRFSSRFPEEVAILHSQLTPAQRISQWQKVTTGSAKVLIGARSCLFCPIPSLKLIIIDEEHDSSFKQDSKLRYHGKNAAIMLGKIKNIPVVLGSATPSLESWVLAQGSHYHYYSLKKKAKAHTGPRIEIIDLKKKESLRPSHLPSWMSHQLYKEMTAVLEKKDQVALFLNRRGTASTVFCDSCGFCHHCPNCDVTLTLHHKKMLLCHYCGYQESLQKHCPSCKVGVSKPYGLGTEQIEADLLLLFPHARLARIDRDEITHLSQLEDVITSIEKREIDILIGTQMIAKGLDFPGLRLVGFVLADIGLHTPDFRAQEKSCQLLFQMAGRSGRHASRAEDAGQVLIQTYRPSNTVFEKVVTQDYSSFLEEEKLRRSELSYPPFGRIALFILESKKQKDLEERAFHLKKLVSFSSKKYIETFKLQILGPAPSPIYKMNNTFRYQLIIKADSKVPLSKICHWCLQQISKVKSRVTIYVDIDPQHLI